MYLFHSIRVHGHIMVKFKLSTYARYVLNLVAMFMVKIRNFIHSRVIPVRLLFKVCQCFSSSPFAFMCGGICDNTWFVNLHFLVSFR